MQGTEFDTYAHVSLHSLATHLPPRLDSLPLFFCCLCRHAPFLQKRRRLSSLVHLLR